MPAFLLTNDSRGVATITLNRPGQHNAFDDVLISELNLVLEALAIDEAVRIVVIKATGKSFSAGADLNWMRRMADYDLKQNRADAMQLARLMQNLNRLPKPTVACVQGAAFGGGVGLVACCDIALASENAIFCLSEVKLGLIPAVISPYVIGAIGARAARRFMLSAERFDANQACDLGLIHQVVAQDHLETRLEKMIETLLEAGPAAQAAAKNLLLDIANRTLDEDLVEDTAARIALIRASEEGREGLNAFLQKRPPAWVKNE